MRSPAALLSILLLTPAAQAAVFELGDNGILYSLRSGTYGELFPGGTGQIPGNPILAVDIEGPAGFERLLVPGTEDADPESSASLLASDDSTIFVVWEHLDAGIFSELLLARFSAEGWSAPLRVAVNPFNRKSPPLLLQSRSEFTAIDEAGAYSRHRRTVLHVVWCEEIGLSNQVLYVPVVFIDDELPEATPYRVLNLLLPDGGGGGAGNADPALYRAVWMQPGDDSQSVLVSFADEATGRLAAVEIDVLAGELGVFVDRARAHIDGVGNRLYPSDLGGFAQEVSAELSALELNLHPAVLGHFSNLISADILGALPGESLADLADRARAHIDGVGARLLAEPVAHSATAGGDDRATILDFAVSGVSQILRLKPRVTAAIPEDLVGSAELLTSTRGRAFVVAWEEASPGGDPGVRYRLFRQGAWSETFELPLGGDVQRADALAMLQALVDRY